MLINNVLVVCVGNICRSPMAEALLRRDHPHLKVHSAGLSALVDHPAHDNALKVMHDIGADMHNHRARQLTSELMVEADLVLCMSKEQQSWIKKQWPMHRGKVYRLGEWLGKNVEDPYRHPLEMFYQTREIIEEAVASWQDRLSQ